MAIDHDTNMEPGRPGMSQYNHYSATFKYFCMFIHVLIPKGKPLEQVNRGIYGQWSMFYLENLEYLENLR